MHNDDNLRDQVAKDVYCNLIKTNPHYWPIKEYAKMAFEAANAFMAEKQQIDKNKLKERDYFGKESKQS